MSPLRTKCTMLRGNTVGALRFAYAPYDFPCLNSPLMHDDFRQFMSEGDLRRFGLLIQQFPKSSFNRSALSQLGTAVIGAAACAGCLLISFTVEVSDKPEEQLPFQQAMWGFAAVGAILSLHGLVTGVWRALVGIAHVGRWWLLFERGLVIVNNGKVQYSGPLTGVHVQTHTSVAAMPKLVDDSGRSLPLPLRAERTFASAIHEQQRRLRTDPREPPRERIAYALALSEGKIFGEDRIFRIYADERAVLVIYAGDFVVEKLGADRGTILPIGAIGLAAIATRAWSGWLSGREFDKRAAYLDAMTIEELRAEAQNNQASVVLTAGTTGNVRLGPPVTEFWSNDHLQSQAKGRLTFEHSLAAWDLLFFTVDDRDYALAALAAALGPERIVCELPVS